MTQNVIFSERAYVALLTETLGEIKTETGGIFLGHYDKNKWYIIESIDPGPNSIFSSSYFEYNEEYVNHLANKINKLYKNPLKIMGLWHRHPGSMDFFSPTDNSTHEKYVNINPFGVISALVNIDPSFRLSIYYITNDKGRLHIPKNTLSFSIGNDKIPNEFLLYNPSDEIIKKIDGHFKQNTKKGYNNKLIEKKIIKAFNINQTVDNISAIKLKDKDLDEIIKTLEEDISFFEEYGIECNMALEENNSIMRLTAEIKSKKKLFEARLFMNNEIIYIKYKDKIYQYGSGFFKDIVN